MVVLALSMAAVGPPDPPRPQVAPLAQPPAPAPPPVVPPFLLAHRDASGRASSFTLLVPAADGKGGALVLLPPGTMTEVISLGLEPVSQSLELGDPARLRATVENLFGAALGGVLVADDAAMADLVAPAGPLRVEVPERVEQVAPSGVVDVVYEVGPTSLAPAATGRFLAAKGRSNDLSRLARHQAFWDAWLATLHQRSAAVPARPPELAAAIRVLAAGPVQTRLVPVEAFGTASGGEELYKVRRDELERMVAALFPTAGRRTPAERPRVQVLNGTGKLGVADAVRARLGSDFDVRLAGNAGRLDYERTEVIYYRPDRKDMADRLQKALGVGRSVLSRRPLDVVDVTVIVGKDFHP